MFSMVLSKEGRGSAGKPGSVVEPPSVWDGASPPRLPAVHPQAIAPEPAGLLLDFAPEEVFRAPPVAGRAVGSYPAFSPLPRRALRRREAVCFLWHCLSPAAPAPGGCPASCSEEPGLSSRAGPRLEPGGALAVAWPRPFPRFSSLPPRRSPLLPLPLRLPRPPRRLPPRPPPSPALPRIPPGRTGCGCSRGRT
jgi:hypothetical protein